MKNLNIFLFVFCLSKCSVLCYASVLTTTMPPQFMVNKFQNNIEQQDFHTILNSIEDRLRNLDNIYSMQLSQTLETKLDLYSRRLESLDTKIIRLEALVMLNLDKISENISTKNFKDDISRTNTYRKMDSLYEGINSKISYLDRKQETNFGKIKEKLDMTITQLTKMEDTLSKRDSNFGTELSDAIFAIDDLKTTYKLMENKLYNITEATMNMAKVNHDMVKRFTMESKRSMNKLHDNIVGNLQYMDNKTSQTMKLTAESNDLLKHMRSELKEDFNNYANKVADMNSDIWKSSDTTEDDLETLAIVVNGTRTELQNGIRTLLLQIGKLEHKDNDISAPNNYQEIDKKLSVNFEKILMNQDVFMNSCHRLQMDEPQIEREISTMLEKLIDMLENKLATETKDIRSFEKALKSHDSRVNRNLHQANSNIISLFEKYVMGSQHSLVEVKKIGGQIEELSSVVHEKSKISPCDVKIIINKLEEIGNNTEIKSEIATLLDIVTKMERKMQHKLQVKTTEVEGKTTEVEGKTTEVESKTTEVEGKTKEIEGTSENVAGEDIMEVIQDIFGPLPNQNITHTTHNSGNSQTRVHKNDNTGRSLTSSNLKSPSEKPLCGLIDVRMGASKNCEEIQTPKRKHKRKNGKHRRPQFDIRVGEDVDKDADEAEYLEEDEIEDNEDNEERITSTTHSTTTNIHEETTEEYIIWT